MSHISITPSQDNSQVVITMLDESQSPGSDYNPKKILVLSRGQLLGFAESLDALAHGLVPPVYSGTGPPPQTRQNMIVLSDMVLQFLADNPEP